MKTVTLYTDGACSGNPGPGGWGAILEFKGIEKELSGGEVSTTNNRMELTAVIQGLKALKEPCIVELYSDSKYVIDALEKGWAWGWKKKAREMCSSTIRSLYLSSLAKRFRRIMKRPPATAAQPFPPFV